jgi:hypothetical protein
MQKMPTNDEIVQVFMSKTVYYRNYHKIFPKVSKGSALKKWLANTNDASDNLEVWSTYKLTFDNLQKILSAQKKRKETSPNRKGKKGEASNLGDERKVNKVKGEKKASTMSNDSDDRQVVNKKGEGKEKNKSGSGKSYHNV